MIKTNPNLPVLAIRDILMTQYSIVPFFIGREVSVAAVDHALKFTGRKLIVVSQKDSRLDFPQATDFYQYGAVCYVVKTKEMPDGRIKVLLQGMNQVKLLKVTKSKYFEAEYQPVKERTCSNKALLRRTKALVEKHADTMHLYADMINVLFENEDVGKMALLLSSLVSPGVKKEYKAFTTFDPVKRLKIATKYFHESRRAYEKSRRTRI